MLTRAARCFVYAELLYSDAACARAVMFARRRPSCIRFEVMWFVGHAGKRVMCRLSRC
jgi:hypothetical protein